MVGNEEFYLNDKLVSVHLSYMEENDRFILTDTVYVCGWWKAKAKKLIERSWIDKNDRYSYSIKDIHIFTTDSELLNWINPIGVNKYSIRHEQVYHNAHVLFNYVNGDKRVKYFNSNSEAENYYKTIKSKYKPDDYIIYDD